MSKRAQTTSIDLFVSLAIFIVLVAFIVYYWGYASSRLNKDLELEDLQLRAYRIADLLAKTPGDPNRWEALPNSQLPSIKSLGLAHKDRELSANKIFNLSRIQYSDLIKILNIEGYEFNITVKARDDILTLLRKHDIRIAYIQIGTKTLPASLDVALAGLFDCKDASSIGDRKTERCEKYTNVASLNDPDGNCNPIQPIPNGCAFATNFNIFENLSEYDLVIMEDPKLEMDPLGTGVNPDYAESQEVIRFVNTGGYLISTVKLTRADSQYAFGMYWEDPGDNGVSTLTVTSDYYTAKDSGEEKFIIFPGSISSPDIFTTNQKNKRVIPIANTSAYLHMFYPQGYPSYLSGARWEFGKGVVYYFSDGKDVGISNEVSKASRRIVETLAPSLYSLLVTSGARPPKNADIVTVQRDISLEGQPAVLEVTLWKSK